MRHVLFYELMQNKEYLNYIRSHPKWYKLLYRHPEMMKDFINEYKVENKLTFHDKIDKISLLLQMIEMMM